MASVTTQLDRREITRRANDRKAEHHANVYALLEHTRKDKTKDCRRIEELARLVNRLRLERGDAQADAAYWRAAFEDKSRKFTRYVLRLTSELAAYRMSEQGLTLDATDLIEESEVN